MNNYTPEIKRCNIVLIGELNPKIFQPDWFAIEDIIGKSEAEKAEIKIIHPDIVVFSLGWMEIQVTRDRFSVLTEQEAYYEPLKDFVLSTFIKLHHSPLHMLGINWDYHYQLKDGDELEKIFDAISPKAKWETVFKSPRFASITMQDISRSDTLKGNFNLKVEPSKKVRNGIFVGCNDHYEISDNKALHGSNEMLTILKDQWKYSQELSNSIIQKIIGLL